VASNVPVAVRKWRCQGCGTLHDRAMQAELERNAEEAAAELLKALGI
jgi:hypothetical protein